MTTTRDIVEYLVNDVITKLAWNNISETEFYMYKISLDYLTEVHTNGN